MPEVIEGGYLYIAQPPLYKIKRKAETYLKMRVRWKIICEAGLSEAVLTMASGEQRSGADLVELVKQARAIRAILDTLPSRYPKFIIEQTAMPVLTPDIMSKPELAEQSSSYIAARLNRMLDEVERGWEGTPSGDGGLVFTRELRGVSESVKIDGPLIASADARRLDAMAGLCRRFIWIRPA